MIGLIAHSEKANARELVVHLCQELQRWKLPYLLERSTAQLIGEISTLDEKQTAAECELLVVLGGDGTMLRVVHRIEENLRPIFGINLGSLGFLTCVGSQEVERAIQSLLHKDYSLSLRSLLLVEIASQHHPKRHYYSLNDVVVSRGELSKLVKLQVSIDGEALTTYNADGLILSTPTGSTAYSLSAGGPILFPNSGGLVISPICPHVLTNRSVVVSDQSQIEIQVTVPSHEVFINVDGQVFEKMALGDILKISKSQRVLPLALLPERPFTEILSEKLKWRGSNV